MGITYLKGAGGKGGGGTTFAPTEDPDSLRSIQYAKVLDLLSEGEIEGLVSGLASIELDGTPIRNENGSLNFKGVSVRTTNGTQSQSALPGFSQVEVERAVGLELTAATSITRTITDPDVDRARITVAIPQLTKQDTKTGNLHGSTVQIAIDVQTGGGGFATQAISSAQTTQAAPVGATQVVASMQAVGIDVHVLAKFQSREHSVEYQVQYRQVGSPTWITHALVSVDALEAPKFKRRPDTRGQDIPWQQRILIDLNSVHREIAIRGLSLATYEARVVVTDSEGPANISITSLDLHVPRYTDTITGKTTSKYQRVYLIDLPGGAGPWDIRVRRVTPDSSTVTLQSKTFWESYTEIIDARLRYPNSALVGISIDSKYFKSIPTRGYRIKGKRVQVPVNYNPLKRTYSGAWNGTFKIAWTNNPAWCFYDLVTNTRYGLGEHAIVTNLKWDLYTIGQYCDQRVPDGHGGTEPRYTCNLYIQQRADALRVLRDMASVFRGMVHYAGGSIAATQDAPSSVVAMYNQTNVIDGRFEYSSSAGDKRHTVAIVAWSDPDSGGRQVPEYVEDAAGIATFGVVETEVIAIGCTSQGQARRLGEDLLFTEQNQTEIVTFSVGLDAMFVSPGKIFSTADPAVMGLRRSGRVVSATTTTVTIDAAITLVDGSTYAVSVMLPSGALASAVPITNPPGDVTVLTLGTALAEIPLVGAVWVVTSQVLLTQLWRCVQVLETSPGIFAISGVSHHSGKYAFIERGRALSRRPVSVIRTGAPLPPREVTITESIVSIGPATYVSNVFISWRESDSVNAWRYAVSYRRVDEGNTITLPEIDGLSVEIQGLTIGIYEFTVRAVNALGLRSIPVVITQALLGPAAPPADITGLTMSVLGAQAILRWTKSTEADVIGNGSIVIRHSPGTTSQTWESSSEIARVHGSEQSAMVALRSGTFFVKALDESGHFSVNAASISRTVATSIDSLNVVATSTQHPTFPGVRVNTAVVNNNLQLDSVGTIGQQLGNVSTWGLLSTLGGLAPFGTYDFNAPIDLGSVQVSRVIAQIQATAVDTLDAITLRTTNISTWDSIGGAVINDATSRLLVRTTNDNPSGSPTWSAYAPFLVGDYTARGFGFRVEIESANPQHNVQISQLSVEVDMPDRIEHAENVSIAAGGTAITFAKPFKVAPAIGVAGYGIATGDYYSITAKSTTGFTLQWLNASAVGVARTTDWTAKAY